MRCDLRASGSFAKHGHRAAEIGPSIGLTDDLASENDGGVTVRDRDSMEQERIRIDALEAYIAEKIEF